jgi:SAM-dependent methyltransferase
MSSDPFARFKAVQREAWASFAPQEIFTAVPAARLVKFAAVAPNTSVLDVACGTGVVALTAARAGARVRALDLTPTLLEHARENARIAGLEVEYVEGDVEALPYPDATFDIVLSQFGHIFAPRPDVALAQMLRVLRPGGRIAFSAWPPESFVGRQFVLLSQYMPPPAPTAPQPAAPADWGERRVVAQRLAGLAVDVEFEDDVMGVPALSVPHARRWHEMTIGPLARIVGSLREEPGRLAELRARFDALAAEVFADNCLSLQFLMARAVKAR